MLKEQLKTKLIRGDFMEVGGDVDNSIDLEKLRKIAPLSRHRWAQGRQFFKPLRQELIHAPIEQIENPKLKIRKLLELSVTLLDGVKTDRIATKLRRRFSPDLVDPVWIQCMVFQRRFAEASQKAENFLVDRPQNRQAHILSANCAMHSGNAVKALQILKSNLKNKIGNISETFDILCEAGEHKWLHENVPHLAVNNGALRLAKQFSPPNQNTLIFCISLDRDYRRFSATKTFLETGGNLQRISGVLGSSMPKVSYQAIGGGDVYSVNAGEYGCALSHIHTWERVAASCADDEYALIVEDDSRFIFGPGYGLNEMKACAHSLGAEVVFVNRRACRVACDTIGGNKLSFVKISSFFSKPNVVAAHTDPGWGADGYLMSGKGARKLLDLYSQVKILGAVDWQIFAHCFDNTPDILNCRATRNIYNVLSNRKGDEVLKGYITNLPIMHCRDFAYSSINTLDKGS